jgi:ABC-type transporter Mla MlaB component
MASDCFALSGDVNRGTVPALLDEFDAFASRTRGDLALDCTDVSSIDPEGIRALIALRDGLARQGRRLHFVRLSDSLIHDVLRPPSSGLPADSGRISR